MSAKRQEASFTLTLPTGKKQYSIYTLIRKDAMRVFHSTVQPILMGITKVAKGGKDVDPAEAVGTILEQVDFETVYEMGSILLDQVMVDGVEIEFEDYYGTNIVELYPAIFQALKANYPDVFQILQPVIDRASAGLEEMTKSEQEESQSSTSTVPGFKIGKSKTSK